MKKTTNALLMLALLLITGGTFAQTQRITVTIAGSGATAFGGDGGWSKLAGVNAPYDVCVDAAGNIYFTDNGNARVRKVSGQTGMITTVAGGGTSTADGVPATNEALAAPRNLCIDAAGNLYVVASTTNQIKRIDAVTNIITTVAGTGATGYSGDGGPAISATFSDIEGICIDGAGNLSLVDQGNSRVRKIAAGTGIVTTIAGTGTAGYTGDGGPGIAATLSSPMGITVDPAGNVYVMDQSGSVFHAELREINATTGIITTIAGSTTSSTVFGVPLLGTWLADVTGVCMDGHGNFYCNEISCSCRELCMATDSTYAVGGNFDIESFSDNVNSLLSYMDEPYGIAVDAAGNVYSADNFNDRIRKTITLTATPTFTYGKGIYLYACAGSPVAIDSQLAFVNINAGETETFTVVSAPLHGSLSGFPTTASSNGTTSIAAPSGISYTVSGTYSGLDSFKVQVSNGTLSDVITVYMSDNSAGSISGPDSLCMESSISLTSAISGGTWSVSDPIATVTPTGIVSGASAGTTSVMYTVNTACGLVTSYHTVTVDAAPPASAGTITGAGSVCASSTLTLADAIGGGVWSVSNSTAAVSTTGMLTGVAAGNDSVYYTLSNACGPTTTSAVITINPLPDAGTITGTTTICKGETAVLTDPTSVGTGVWSVSNSHSTISASGAVTAISSGLDIIYYTVTTVCGTDSTSVVINVNDCGNTGVASTSLVSGISVFPNPASGALNIQWQALDPGNADLSITDVAGRVVLKSEMVNSGSGSMALDVSNLSEGVYLLNINSDSIHFIDKIVIRN